MTGSRERFQLRRVHWVIAGFTLVAFRLLLRAWSIQISSAECLKKKASGSYVHHLKLAAPRGEIYERNGKVLAISSPVADIVINPSEVCKVEKQRQAWLTQQLKQQAGIPLEAGVRPLEPKPDVIAELVRILSAEYPEIQEKKLRERVLRSCRRSFIYVKRHVIPRIAQKIQQAELPGVEVRPAYRRFYPQGELFGHLVGFTNIDGKGLAGLEYSYDSTLKGHQGQIRLIRNRLGQLVELHDQLRPLKPGRSLHLTVDHRIQYFTYVALKRAIKQHQAKSAAAVVLDARTGEILAIASQPGFNPNNVRERKPERVRNHAVSDWIEPGSTVKPLVMAYALAHGIVRDGERINTSPGRLKVQDGAIVRDDYNKGTLTLTKVIQKSSNVAMAKIALRMRLGTLARLYRKLGFDRGSGLRLHAEQPGRLRKGWGRVDHVWSSFGYGIHVNLLQLARAYLPFANRGRMIPLKLVRDDPVDPDGSYPVYPAWAVQKVLRMMETVVQKGGTAPDAAIPGYHVAGKTGTVHKFKKGRRGYQSHTYASLFVGLVPSRNPDMIMAVVVDEPSRGKYFGGEVAAPVFREVMSRALRLRNIPPR